MQDVYVDVLLVLNIYVNYFILKITAVITHSPLRTKRSIAASAYGSLFSLLIFAPEIDNILITAIKAAAAVTIVIAAFGLKDKKRIFINTAAFFTVNFLLAGFIYFVYSSFSPQFVIIGNSFFYIDFSLIVLIISTALFYFAVGFFRRIFSSGCGEKNCYNVMIKYKDKTVSLAGLADTGNSLRDHFTGDPVIICDRERFLIDENDAEKLPKGFRLIPCSTVSGSAVIPVFIPDKVIIKNKISGAEKTVNALIGLGQSSGKAIFDPSILNF